MSIGGPHEVLPPHGRDGASLVSVGSLTRFPGHLA